MLQNKLQMLVDKSGTIELVIPVYNEECILESQLAPVLRNIPEGFTISIVENGSTDATVSILKKMQEDNICLKVTSLREASYGNAVRHGLACLACKQGEELSEMSFVKISGLEQDGVAGGGIGSPGVGGGDGGGRVLG